MGSSATQPQALLAQRDADARNLFQTLFEKFGWRYEILSDGQSVVEAAALNKYELVVADVPMPGLPSVEFLKALRRLSPTQAIIVTTKDGSVEEAIENLNDAAITVVTHPVKLEGIETALNRLIQNSKYDDRNDRYYKFVASERTVYHLTTRELAHNRLPLVIAERLMQCGQLDENSKLRLELAFQEALANALEHGNLELDSSWREQIDSDGQDKFTIEKQRRLNDSSYANRKITVVTDLNGSRLEIRVRDQGKGFTPSVKDPIAKESVLSSGRGMALIHQTMDEVRHFDGGREIIMVKTIKRGA